MTRIAAFDVGSTNVRYALGTIDGELTTEVFAEPTEPRRLLEQLGDRLADLRERAAEPIEAACVASTGLVDHDRGVVEKFDANEPARNRYDLDVRAALSSRHDVTVVVDNDVNAAALGEHRFGGGEYDTMVYVNVGSGIGAGVVAGGTLLRGERGHAGEVGMMPVAVDATLEASGVPGAWEAYCSGAGIEQFLRRKLADDDRETVLGRTDDPVAADLFAAARDGDAPAREYLAEINEYNAAAVAALANVFDPGAVVFGGSVALENPDLFLDPIRAGLSRRLLVADPDLRASSFESNAGLVGALALYDR